MKEENKSRVIYYTRMDPQYPQRMREMENMPGGIYTLGRLPDEKKKSAAIVGARLCTGYGYEQAYRFAYELARAGVEIISGMAQGIDSCAHEGALDAGGSTIAVLGCGVDICYPASSRRTYERLQKNGGILSEYPCGVPPLAFRFPERNRIISALADVVLVVEAKKRSGSLITADLALDQGKSVMAVPGRITDRLSEGCNWLISQGAGIARAPSDVLAELGLTEKTAGVDVGAAGVQCALTAEERCICLAIREGARTRNALVGATGIPFSRVNAALTKLQLSGAVTVSGGEFQCFLEDFKR